MSTAALPLRPPTRGPARAGRRHQCGGAAEQFAVAFRALAGATATSV